MSEYYINLNIESPERFDLSRFLEFSDNYDPLTSSFLRNVKTLTSRGYYVVQTEEYRPELISYKIYENTQYWWILLIYNDLPLLSDMVPGLVLNFPSLEDVEDLYFTLKSQSSVNA